MDFNQMLTWCLNENIKFEMDFDGTTASRVFSFSNKDHWISIDDRSLDNLFCRFEAMQKTILSRLKPDSKVVAIKTMGDALNKK